jgi:predicted ATPase
MYSITAEEIKLNNFNAVIQPNRSGKSNLIEAIEPIRSLQSTSENSNLLAAIRDGGDTKDWLRKYKKMLWHRKRISRKMATQSLGALGCASSGASAIAGTNPRRLRMTTAISWGSA